MSVDPTGSSIAMDCAELERSLEPWLDGELDERDVADVRAHLDACPRCRGLADEQSGSRNALRRCLKRALGEEPAPSDLRLRIVDALDRERRPWWRRALAPVPLAAVAACVAGMIVVFTVRKDADPLVEEAVRRHVRDLPLEITAASAGVESIPGWFAGKLDFNPRPPRFDDPAVKLVGARLSHISDHPAAYMRYDLPRGRAGLFIMEDRDRRFGGGCERPVRVGPHVACVRTASGYNIAVWRRNEIVYSLVSDLDEEQLVRLVRSAAVQPAAER